MKKILLFLTVLCVTVCAFAVLASAEEQVSDVTDTYYLVQSQDSEAAVKLKSEGKQIVTYSDIIGPTGADATSVFFGDFAVGSHIEIIFAEDIFVPKTIIPSNTGILINTAITVTFRYNGFAHYVDNYGGSSQNGIVVRGSNAYVRLIGTRAMDENGVFNSEFVGPTGDIAEGNFKVNGCFVDVFKYDENYVDVYDGKVYIENLRAYTGYATVKAQNSGNANITIVNGAFYSVKGRSINLNESAPKTINIDGGYYKGLRGYSVRTGSFVKNCKIDEAELHIDTWNLYMNVWEFINCDLTKTTKISSSTGRTHYVFRDCTFNPNGVNWSLDGDGGGDQFVRIYKSATCTENGSIELVRSNSKGTANPYADEIAAFSAPALGHKLDKNNILSVAYTSYLEKGTYTSSCARCSDGTATGEAPALFTCPGYSIPEDGRGALAVGYDVNVEAIALYEKLTNQTLKYGVYAVLKDTLGENDIFDEDGKATDGVINAEVSGDSYVAVELKITGFTDEYKDLKLAMGAYVITTENEASDGEATESKPEYSYLQVGEPNEGEKYFFVSYNDVAKKPSTEEDVA